MDAVVTHNSFWHVSERFMIGFSVDPAQKKGNIYFLRQLYPQQLVSSSQILQPQLQLLTHIFFLHNPLNRINPSVRLMRPLNFRDDILHLQRFLRSLLDIRLLAEKTPRCHYNLPNCSWPDCFSQTMQG